MIKALAEDILIFFLNHFGLKKSIHDFIKMMTNHDIELRDHGHGQHHDGLQK